jgi:succinoglycan biosynthesis transport protein ExoP
VTMADLIAALRARWRLELAIAALVFAAVVASTILSPRQYVATATLLFDDRQSQTVEPEGAQSKIDANVLGTQADIVASAATATDMVKRLRLADKPDIRERWTAAGSPGTIEGWVGRSLLGNLTVEPDRNTNVLSVRYQSSDPKVAAQMANGFAATFIDTRLRLETDPARAYTRWFQARTGEVRAALEKAQQRLVDYQSRTGVISIGTADVETARLKQLETQLADAQAARAQAQAQAGSGASASSEVQSSGVVQGLRTQIAVKSAEISQQKTIYGPNHPIIRSAEAELGTLRAKLNSEIGTGTRSVGVASNAASGREAELRTLVDKQRSHVLGLGTDRSQLDVLQRDVDSARAAYDNVMSRLSTMRLQAELPSTNVRQLDEARPPVLPTTPNVPVRLLMGLILGAMLGIGIAGLLELLFPRVRTPSGLATMTEAPVLGMVEFGKSAISRRLSAEGSKA